MRVYECGYVNMKMKMGMWVWKWQNKNVSKYAEHVSMYKVGGGAGADGVSRESWAASGAAAEGAGELQWSRWLAKMVLPWSDFWT